MTRLSQLIGQPTISLADAEQRGRVEGVQLERGRVMGLRTSEGLVETSAIRTFEGDAVTYDGAATAVDEKADSPLGRRVLTEDGDELGRLADLDITDDGTALRAIGSYAVIVAALPDTTVTGSPLPPPPVGTPPA